MTTTRARSITYTRKELLCSRSSSLIASERGLRFFFCLLPFAILASFFLMPAVNGNSFHPIMKQAGFQVCPLFSAKPSKKADPAISVSAFWLTLVILLWSAALSRPASQKGTALGADAVRPVCGRYIRLRNLSSGLGNIPDNFPGRGTVI